MKMTEQENPSAQSQVRTQSFTCSGCGGTMQYNIAKEKFVCTACGREEDIESAVKEIKEYDFSHYQEREQNSVPFEGMSAVTCQNCGAEIIFEAKDTAVLCPMCGSSHVAAEKQRSGIPPEGIIPFQFDAYEAQRYFHKWVKDLWFAPNALKSKYQEGNLNGIYIPFWTFDAYAVGYYSGLGGIVRVEEGENGEQRTTVDWVPVAGVVDASFDDIQICASRREGSDIIQKVEPYNTINRLKPYSSAYLSGYKAEHYTVRADEGFEAAKNQIYNDLRSRAMQDIMFKGFQQAQVLSLDLRFSDVTYKHVLLPVYTSFFNYAGKQYIYAINGETGRVSGERPYSPVKIGLAVAAAVLVCYLLYLWMGDGSSSSYGILLENILMYLM